MGTTTQPKQCPSMEAINVPSADIVTSQLHSNWSWPLHSWLRLRPTNISVVLSTLWRYDRWVHAWLRKRLLFVDVVLSQSVWCKISIFDIISVFWAGIRIRHPFHNWKRNNNDATHIEEIVYIATRTGSYMNHPNACRSWSGQQTCNSCVYMN